MERVRLEKERLKREAEKRKALEQELARLRRERQAKAAQPKIQVAAKETPKKEPQHIKVAKAVPASATKPVEHGTSGAVKTASLHAPATPPKKDSARLTVTSNVEGARVYIDKKEDVPFWTPPEEKWIFRGTAPYSDEKLTPGKHHVRLHKDGFLEEVKTIELKPGETLELDVTLFKNTSETGDEDTGGGGRWGRWRRWGDVAHSRTRTLRLCPVTNP